MRDLTPELLAHLASGGTRLSVCWQITRNDGVVLRSTDHDRDISVSVGSPDRFNLTGVYSAVQGFSGSNVSTKSDLSVSNLEAAGGFVFDGIDGDDLEAGLFDKAAYCIFQCMWDNPDQGVIIHSRGTLGDLKRDTDTRWKCELRSLTQALSQVQGRSYGVLCDADLGDERCGVNLADFTFVGIVANPTDSRRTFDALVTTGSPSLPEGYFQYGVLTFTSGQNLGYSREVASDAGGMIELFEEFPRPITEDDTFTISAGCNKQHNIEVLDKQDEPPSVQNGRVTGDCEVKFSNGVNFRGFPNKPGPDTVVRLRTPSAKAGGSGGKK